MRSKKIIRAAVPVLALAMMMCIPASAAGNVASAVEQTWTGVAQQIKTVVDSVVFPALDMILVIALFCKGGMLFFEYRKHGQFEWTGVAIIFACLIFTLTAPAYIWGIVGM